MTLCPRCETDLGSAYTGETCPRCGVRLSARRRSLSGFSLPTAAAATGSSPPPSRSTAPPPRHDVAEDSWGVSDLPPAPVPSSPPPAAHAPRGLGVFRAPTDIAPRGVSAPEAWEEVGVSTVMLAPQAPPPSPGADAKRTSVGVGPASVGAEKDPRRTVVGMGAVTAPPQPASRVKQTLVQTLVQTPAVPASPAPPPANVSHTKQTLMMTPALPQRAPSSASVVGPTPHERPGKSTLVMTPSPLAQGPASPAPSVASRPEAPGPRRRLDLRAPERTPAPPPPPSPEPLAAQEVLAPAEPPSPFIEPAPSEPQRDTVDPLASTQPVDALVEAIPTPPIAPTPPAAETLSVAAPVVLAPPSAPVWAPLTPPPGAAPPPRRTPSVRAPQPVSVPHAARRLRFVSLIAGALLAVLPWGAPLPSSERVTAVAAGAVALLVALAPIGSALRGALASGLGALLLGALLVTTTDLVPLGLGLTGALLLVLPGAMFFRRDTPDARAGLLLTALGLAIGVAWLLSPEAGNALRLSFPPASAREYATLALIPWLVLGLLSLPQRTASVAGGLFAGGVLLWSGALGMLRSDAITLASPDRWRVVAVHGVSVGAVAALVAAGVAFALAAASPPRDT